jgi:hypothetical protein
MAPLSHEHPSSIPHQDITAPFGIKTRIGIYLAIDYEKSMEYTVLSKL